MRPGDVFQMARTECGELGVSVLRQGNLIFAAGEVSAAQLGSTIQARVPGELIQGAERLFRQHDPKFEFSDLPIEIGSAEECSIQFHGSVSRMVITLGSAMVFFRVFPARQNVWQSR